MSSQSPFGRRGTSDYLRRFNRRDTHPVFQFVKYGIAGGIASAVHLTVFFLAAWRFFPALTPNDPFVQLLAHFGTVVPTPALSDAVRSNHTMLCNIVAFLFSNTVAYVINILWVFERGRHGWLKELLLFFAASGASVLVGTALAGGLVRWTGIATTYAFAANIVAAVAINYAARKFFIFKG